MPAMALRRVDFSDPFGPMTASAVGRPARHCVAGGSAGPGDHGDDRRLLRAAVFHRDRGPRTRGIVRATGVGRLDSWRSARDLALGRDAEDDPL